MGNRHKEATKGNQEVLQVSNKFATLENSLEKEGGMEDFDLIEGTK